MLALSVAFGDIAKHGETYRELEPKDRMPPVDQYSRGILAKQDRVCVADIVHALIAECEQKGQPLSAVEEDTQTILALFDLRDEALSGTLSSRYKAIERAVEAIESC